MTNILVTNDDGIDALGLKALAHAMLPFGKVTVIAPAKNWSIAGHSKTLRDPLRTSIVDMGEQITAYICDGTPSDCVALGFLGLLKEPIDLVVSGINPYANLGSDLTYSGTVTAAMEAIIWKTPAAAFSINGRGAETDPYHYESAAEIAHNIVAAILKNKLPEGVLLCVNIPDEPVHKIKGYQVTRQGRRIYRDVLISRLDPFGRTYHWIGGEPPTGIPEDGTDIGALSQGFVSITPIHLDMTSHQHFHALNQWNWSDDRV